LVLILITLIFGSDVATDLLGFFKKRGYLDIALI